MFEPSPGSAIVLWNVKLVNVLLGVVRRQTRGIEDERRAEEAEEDRRDGETRYKRREEEYHPAKCDVQAEYVRCAS